MKIVAQEMPQRYSFRYLDLIISIDVEINEDDAEHINAQVDGTTFPWDAKFIYLLFYYFVKILKS